MFNEKGWKLIFDNWILIHQPINSFKTFKLTKEKQKKNVI